MGEKRCFFKVYHHIENWSKCRFLAIFAILGSKTAILPVFARFLTFLDTSKCPHFIDKNYSTTTINKQKLPNYCNIVNRRESSKIENFDLIQGGLKNIARKLS